MSDVVERFLRYVQVDSPSNDANEEVTPSSPEQFDMANLLKEELLALGLTDAKVDEHAYVTATVPASEGAEDLPALGLIAHIDAVTDAPARGIKPQIVHYTGGDLKIGEIEGETISVSPEDVEDLNLFVDQDIICSSGDTLLSADDKAGVAEIIAYVARLMSGESKAKHPTLKLAFVPDEEIGHGASLLDLEAFGAKYAYTVDGETLGEINCETFNAMEAKVFIKGVMVHPGAAKGRMINAISVAAEFDQMVPQNERPEYTEGREGFYHPTDITGDAAEVMLQYILRDHDAKKIDERAKTLKKIAAYLNDKYGEGTITLKIKEEYRNMVEVVNTVPELIDNAIAAHKALGMEPKIVAVRGGTDGSQLSLRGLPCPNLATGGYLAHSVREFIPVKSMEFTVDLLEKLCELFVA